MVFLFACRHWREHGLGEFGLVFRCNAAILDGRHRFRKRAGKLIAARLRTPDPKDAETWLNGVFLPFATWYFSSYSQLRRRTSAV